MKVLVACEESQEVCKAFRKLGHDAYSCDIIPCSGGHPEWHIQDDVLKHLDDGWDLMIAHPPCTYLSAVATRHLYPKSVLNEERYKKGVKAASFFMKLLNADIPKICVENPVQFKIFRIPKYNQIIQPYYFNDNVMKTTCLWLKGLFNLKHPNPKILDKPKPLYVSSNGKNVHWTDASKGGKNRARNRSKTFPGIAKAMAEQWGGLNG